MYLKQHVSALTYPNPIWNGWCRLLPSNVCAIFVSSSISFMFSIRFDSVMKNSEMQ